MKKSVLLLGGTGAMGNHLVQILQDGDFSVYVTSRSDRKSMENVTYIKGNAHDDAFLDKLLSQKKWDVIVDFMIYNSKEFSRRVDRLLGACKQYVFLSSSRVYADSEEPITERSPRLLDVCKNADYLETDEYALSKAREENVLLESEHRNWTIIRPYITYSEIRLQLGVLEKDYWLYQALHDRTIVFSKDIASKTTTLTYGYDVARGIASILGKEEALGEVFHITVDEHHTWQEIFDMYLRVLEEELGRKPKVLMLDENPRVRMKGHGYQVKYDRYYNRIFDNHKIGKYIDVKTFKPTLSGLEQCLREFIHHPSYRITGWGDFAMYDRIAGEWTPLSEIPTLKNKIKYILRRTILPLK
mgnify:CR=1 FL=1